MDSPLVSDSEAKYTEDPFMGHGLPLLNVDEADFDALYTKAAVAVPQEHQESATEQTFSNIRDALPHSLSNENQTTKTESDVFEIQTGKDTKWSSQQQTYHNKAGSPFKVSVKPTYTCDQPGMEIF